MNPNKAIETIQRVLRESARKEAMEFLRREGAPLHPPPPGHVVSPEWKIAPLDS